MANLTLDGEMSISLTMDGENEFLMKVSSETHETYIGEYKVSPIPFDEIELDTKNKYMRDNVSVSAIPYYETSNLGGGMTAIIGG